MRLRTLVPHLAALLVAAGCLALMLWQLDRAEDKRIRLAEVAAAPTMGLDDVDTDTDVPARVRSTGRFEPGRQLLLDNQVHQRQPGVHVFTPWRLVDGRQILVNRGWAAWPDRSRPRPDPQPPETATIQGLLAAPPEVGLRLGEGSELDPGRWPNLATYFDLEPIRALYGPALLPQVVQLDPDHPAHLTGSAWPVVTFGPERHLGYAFQWGLMAGVVVAIWGGLSWRARRAGGGRPDNPESR